MLNTLRDKIDISFIKSSAVIGIGNILSRALGLVFFVIAARMYSPEDYGYIRYIIAVAMIAATGVISGFPQTLSRFLGKYEKNQDLHDSYFSNSLLGLFLMLSATLIIILVIRIDFGVVIIVLGLTIYYTYFGIIRGFFLNNKIVLFTTGDGLAKIFFSLAVFYIIGLKSPFIILIIFAFSSMVPLLFLEVADPINIKFKKKMVSKGTLKDLTRFAIPLIIADAAYTILFGIDIILIEYFLNKEQVGFYAVSKTLTQGFLLVPTAISTILMPKVAGARKQMHLKYLKISIIVTAASSLLLFIFIYAFGNLLISVIFTSAYIGGLSALYVLSIGSIFFAIYMILENFWIGIGNPLIHMKIMMVSMIISVVANIYLIPRIGILGSAVSFGIAAFTGFLLLGFFTFKNRKNI